MKPPPFEYHRPQTVEQMVELLDQYGEGARILAGGQSLMPSMNFRLSRPEHIIDINQIQELNHISVAEDHLVVGALTRHIAFEQPVTEDVLGSMLSSVCCHLAHWPIRVRGTFAGSLAHADPAAEWCLVAVTVNANIRVLSREGEKDIKASDFFKGGFQTALGPKDAIIQVTLPFFGEGARYGFMEISRRTGDFALAMVLSLIWLDEDGLIDDALLGVGGVQSYPLRMHEAEAKLKGALPTTQVFHEAAELVGGNLNPMEDIHGDAEFRRDLARTLTFRSLERALNR